MHVLRSSGKKNRRSRVLGTPFFTPTAALGLGFTVGIEIVIDSCCATFTKVQKRGKDFWNEFELYAADLLIGSSVWFNQLRIHPIKHGAVIQSAYYFVFVCVK